MILKIQSLHRLSFCLLGLSVVHCSDATVKIDKKTDSENGDADSFDTDTSGDLSTDSAADAWIPTVEDAYTEVDRAEIGVVPFVQDTMLEYHITMDPAVYVDMEENGDDEVYRKATLEVRGADVSEDYALVGIRKGATAICTRRPWERAAADFPRILQKARDDFEAHLAQGYVVEEPL